MKHIFNEYQKVKVISTGETGTIVDLPISREGIPYYYVEMDIDFEVLDFKEEELESI